MPPLPPYHCNPQTAQALLGPVEAAVRELAARTRHYEARMRFVSDADRAALQGAHQRLASAAADIAQLADSARPTSG